MLHQKTLISALVKIFTMGILVGQESQTCISNPSSTGCDAIAVAGT